MDASESGPGADSVSTNVLESAAPAECSRNVAASQSSKSRVLLVSDGSPYLSFRLPKLIHGPGVDVDVLCLPGDLIAYSRHVHASFRSENVESMFARLTGILRDPTRPWQAVIVVNEDLTRRLIAIGDSELLKNWQPGAINPQVREFLLSKFGLQTVFNGRQVVVPPSRVCQTPGEIERFGTEFGWPVMVKPPDQAGGTGVRKLDSPAELKANRSLLAFPILSQKFIVGERGVVDLFCSMGKPMAWLASYTIKREGGDFGYSTARLFRAMPGLQPIVEDVARFTKFEGFCGFDWVKEEATNRYHLVEFHPRPPSGFRFGGACGVDFSSAVAAWLRRETETFAPIVQARGHSIAAYYFIYDFLRCLRERDWSGLKAWLPGSGACHDVFWDDAPLFAAWFAQKCRGLVTRLLRKAAHGMLR